MHPAARHLDGKSAAHFGYGFPFETLYFAGVGGFEIGCLRSARWIDSLVGSCAVSCGECRIRGDSFMPGSRFRYRSRNMQHTTPVTLVVAVS